MFFFPFVSLKSFVILVAFAGFVVAQVDNDEGRIGGRGCFIVPPGTTNCTGLTGDRCNNVSSLTVSTVKLGYNEQSVITNNRL